MDLNEQQLRDKFMKELKTGNTVVDKYINEMGKVDINLANDLLCEQCQSDKFQLFHYLKRVPEISSPSGNPVIIPIQAFACIDCSHVNSDFTKQSKGK